MDEDAHAHDVDDGIDDHTGGGIDKMMSIMLMMMFFLDFHKREKMTLQGNSTQTPTGCASSSESIHPTSMIAG